MAKFIKRPTLVEAEQLRRKAEYLMMAIVDRRIMNRLGGEPFKPEPGRWKEDMRALRGEVWE